MNGLPYIFQVFLTGSVLPCNAWYYTSGVILGIDKTSLILSVGLPSQSDNRFVLSELYKSESSKQPPTSPVYKQYGMSNSLHLRDNQIFYQKQH